MNKLSAFLNPLPINEEREVIISERFVERDEKGNPVADADGHNIIVPFKIRAISQAENDRLVKEHTHKVKINGQYEDRLDDLAYSRALLIAGTVEPDFRSTQMCEAYGTLNPLEVPGRMLLAGEYRRLSRAIMELSGFNDDDAVIDEAKN